MASARNGKLKAQEQATVQQRDARAIELASSGMSYQQIADELGYRTKSAAWTAVMRGLARHESPHVDELRKVQSVEIDELRAAWWEKAMAGDNKAAAVIVRCWERKARLFGLDAPVKVDATIRDEVDQQIRQLAEQLGQVGDGAATP